MAIAKATAISRQSSNSNGSGKGNTNVNVKNDDGNSSSNGEGFVCCSNGNVGISRSRCSGVVILWVGDAVGKSSQRRYGNNKVVSESNGTPLNTEIVDFNSRNNCHCLVVDVGRWNNHFRAYKGEGSRCSSVGTINQSKSLVHHISPIHGNHCKIIMLLHCDGRYMGSLISTTE